MRALKAIRLRSLERPATTPTSPSKGGATDVGSENMSKAKRQLSNAIAKMGTELPWFVDSSTGLSPFIQDQPVRREESREARPPAPAQTASLARAADGAARSLETATAAVASLREALAKLVLLEHEVDGNDSVGGQFQETVVASAQTMLESASTAMKALPQSALETKNPPKSTKFTFDDPVLIGEDATHQDEDHLKGWVISFN
jgi:hypothetical protein